MHTYKREEGLWARAPLAIVGGALTIALTGASMDWSASNARYVWAGLLFILGASISLFFAFFHPKTGEVLIDTESEMRKVVWPTREEVTGSAMVVIGTTVLLGMMLYMMDIVLATLFGLIGLYPT